MSTMTLFYAQLNNGPEVYDPYFQGLKQLAAGERTQLTSLNVGWDPWAVGAA